MPFGWFKGSAKSFAMALSPSDKAWMSIKKIIDSLHIRNHKDKSCKEQYDPALLKEEIPYGNMMEAKQTFVWLSRYKKKLCAMQLMKREHFPGKGNFKPSLDCSSDDEVIQ